MEVHIKKFKTIQICENTHTLVKVYAAQEGKSITDIVEKSVRNYINNKVNK